MTQQSRRAAEQHVPGDRLTRLQTPAIFMVGAAGTALLQVVDGA